MPIVKSQKKAMFVFSSTLLSSRLIFGQGVPGPPAPAQNHQAGVMRPATVPAAKERLQSFKFESADIDTVMTQYCEWTGKIYLKTDAVQTAITLKADRLTTAESIEVVEAILAMNNIALVPMGGKYLKVIQANAGDLVGQGMAITLDPDVQFQDSDRFVTTIIPLRNVQIQEVQAAVQHVLHTYGKILTLQRSNSIMVTDTESNVKRARELIEFIDQATAQIEQRIYQINHAEALDIARKIGEIITAAKGEEAKPQAGNPYARIPPGVIRASASAPKEPAQASIANTEGSNAVLIQGNVKVLSDERTNIIIIFSQKENFPFFEKIIEVLDVAVEPVTTFEVVNLEYANANDLADTLNSLIGASGSSRPGASSRTSTGSASSRSNASSRNNSGNTLRLTPNADLPKEGISNLSRLSEETKILADERSNSILLMGERSGIAALKKVIASLDVMLEQVMIEAAIFEVTITDRTQTGIDWLFRDNNNIVSGWGGTALLAGSNAVSVVGQNLLSYYQNLSGINTQLAISLSKEDDDVRLLSSPIIMTTDNTEARLSVGEQRPVVTSTSSFGNSSGTLRSSYEYKDIGINLTVTPRINPERVVVLEILQQADQVGGTVSIDENDVPIILNREFEAEISVPDRNTIALGGLINNEKREELDKIPFLGDIPIIGRYLFSNTSEEYLQTELLVLLTPYVLTTDAEMESETRRRYGATSMQPENWPGKGWSESRLQYQGGSFEVLEGKAGPPPADIRPATADTRTLLEQTKAN